MKPFAFSQFAIGAACTALMLATGCHHRQSNCCCEETHPLGTISDPVWMQQEENAEASDFVIHEHEFRGNSIRLNRAGEEHVKQIAARVESTPFPVIVQTSSMSVREGDVHGFPVHPDDDLDLQRRDLVVKALMSMGVENADELVVVGPALTPGFEQFEAEQSYNRGFSTQGGGFGRGGFGGGFGGFGGFGTFGGGF